MKTRTELMNIACMTSANVMGVVCVFEMPNRNTPHPKKYLYKCPRDLGETLRVGELVLVEYENMQSSSKDRPVTSSLVFEVQDSFDPENMSMVHRWLFDRVDIGRVEQLRKWENETSDTLLKSQRRRAREAVLREIVGEGAVRPEFPVLMAPTRGRTMHAAHETPDNGFSDDEEEEDGA